MGIYPSMPSRLYTSISELFCGKNARKEELFSEKGMALSTSGSTAVENLYFLQKFFETFSRLLNYGSSRQSTYTEESFSEKEMMSSVSESAAVENKNLLQEFLEKFLHFLKKSFRFLVYGLRLHTVSLTPEAALEKALSTVESRAALGDKLLQDAFLKAAENENFQLTYFKNFENVNRFTFRWRLTSSKDFGDCFLEYFKKDIEEQEKKNAPGTPILEMGLFPSVNQNRRGIVDIPITHVILHHTATETTEQALNTLRNGIGGVSAHYLIGRDGELICLVPDKYQAWHAGVSSWQGRSNMNFYSIGIELVNTGYEEFTEEQMNKLLQLLEVLKGRHHIPDYNFISHADIAPGRKIDLNVYFPWEQLAKEGFGLWLKEGEKQEKLPDDFEITDALSKVGYQVGALENAIKAFSLHYLAEEKTELNEDDKLILYSLAVKCGSQQPTTLDQNTIEASINYA